MGCVGDDACGLHVWRPVRSPARLLLVLAMKEDRASRISDSGILDFVPLLEASFWRQDFPVLMGHLAACAGAAGRRSVVVAHCSDVGRCSGH